MGFFDLGNEKKDKGFSLFSFLENNQENDDNQDLDKFGLNSWQKEEVKKKNYSLWNFEEEELEDDDYFSEDDDV